MIVVTNSWRMWLVGLAVSLGIFLVIYFTVVKPNTDNANKLVNNALTQEQNAFGTTPGTAGGATSNAQKLQDCLASVAPTDTNAVAACESKYGG